MKNLLLLLFLGDCYFGGRAFGQNVVLRLGAPDEKELGMRDRRC